MNPAVVPVLLIGFFVLVFGLMAWLSARQSKLTSDNVQRMATALGLEAVAKPPTLGLFFPEARAAGHIRGRRVELFPFVTGAGKSRIQWSAVSAAVTATTLTFHLRRQGFGTKFMELFGARELQVGDAEFDAAWFIQTNQPEYLAVALLPEVRAKVMALVREPGAPARGMEIRLEAGTVRYAEIGSFASSDVGRRCQRAAEIVCDLAEVAELAAR